MQLTYNSMTVLKERILLPEETPKQMLQRVSKCVASGDPHMEKQFFNMMDNLYFLPNSPCLMNAGGIGQLFACFVLPINDNMESIFGTLKDMAMVQKSGGGVGFSGSRLRPKGDIVNSTSGVASGPVSFFNIYNSATEEIKQGGKRRGANLATLVVHHPDIIEFIKSKTYKGRLQNFNISVGITDKFMQAVTNGEDYDLVNPRTGELAGRKNAREVFELIAECAWLTGDPGVIFLDTINKHNPTPGLGRIETTNPCFTGDMRLMMADGSYKTFKELAGGEWEIMGSDGEPSKSEVWKTGVKNTVRLRLSDGTIIKCTPDHKFLTLEDRVLEAKDTKNKKLVPAFKFRMEHDPFYVKLGYINGDGQLSRLASENHAGLEVNIGVNDDDMWKYFEGDNYTFSKDKRRIYLVGYKEHFQRLGFDAKTLPNRTLPKTYWNWNLSEKASFLKGLMSANGCVIRGHRVSHKTTCRKLAEQIVLTLKRDFNINAYITKNKAKDVEFDNGTYRCRKSYDVNISRFQSLLKFYNMIGFCHQYKEKHLRELLVKKCPYVRTIEPNGKHPVYDFSEPRTNWGIVEGVVAHNCGEVPLLPYESCVLGSINLSKMVRDDKVDYGLLKNTTWLGVEFLNNIIDINHYSLPVIEAMTKANRKIGLGVMGWGDMLYKLEVPYNSDDALRLAEKVMGFINKEAQKASQEMALKSGSFPNYPQSTRTVPRANACVTSIAPTGTISVIADCSSGIEPIFGLVYYETALDGKQMKMVNPIFLDELRRKKLYSDKLLDDIQNNNGSIQDLPLPEDMRRVFVVAHDVTPERHVKMQAAFQKHVELSVSKTVNLPHSATTKDVANVFVLAYYSGCKGITVYRDRSRDDQVLSCQIGCETC